MLRIHFICWPDDEAEAKAKLLHAAGYEVIRTALDYRGLRQIKENDPHAVVVDLDRRPSHGRQAAALLRGSKSTRRIPIVFAGGDEPAVARAQSQLPDAIYTTWKKIRSAVRRAIKRPPAAPIVPPGPMEGYSGTPLHQKLGIRSGMTVVLVDAPQDVGKLTKAFPSGVTLRKTDRGKRDLTIWFVRRRVELDRRFPRMADKIEDHAAMWVVWPKRASGVPTDVTQTLVRNVGLATGLVDYKICAVDQTWSGLKFTQRKRSGRSE